MGFLSLGAHFRAFLGDPKGVAAVFPTSAAVLDRIASKAGPAGARLIVEYGPGTGVLTRVLLDSLDAEGRLVAIEHNAGLAERLTDVIEDPRLTVVRDTAERVLEILHDLELGPAEYVFSGIPLFWLGEERVGRLVASTHSALSVGGKFVPYQVFYLGRRRLRVHLERSFSEVRSELDLRNLPPYRIFEAVR